MSPLLRSALAMLPFSTLSIGFDLYNSVFLLSNHLVFSMTTCYTPAHFFGPVQALMTPYFWIAFSWLHRLLSVESVPSQHWAHG